MKLSSLLPDIRLMAPGMPEPWQYRFLVRSLQEFLSRSEIWQEWTTYAYDFDNANGGVYFVLNSKVNPTTQADPVPYVRTNRVHKVLWVPTNEEIEKVTGYEMTRRYPDWLSRHGREPDCWAPYTPGGAAVSVPAVQFNLFPDLPADETTGALRFLVSHTVTEAENPDDVAAFDGIADWIVRRYRDTLVAGALAKALIAPGTDWFNPQIAQMHGTAFNEGVIKAMSETQAGQTSSSTTVTYGGY